MVSRIDELLASLEGSTRHDLLELKVTPPSMEKHDAWMEIAEGADLPLSEEEAFGAAEEVLVRDLWLDEFRASNHRSLYYRSVADEPDSARGAVLQGWAELVEHGLPIGATIQDLVRRRQLGLLDSESFLYFVAKRLNACRPSQATGYLLGMGLGAVGEWMRAATVFQDLASRCVHPSSRVRTLSNWSNCLVNAKRDREALAVADRMIESDSEPWVWITLLVTATRAGEMSRVAAAGYNLEELFRVDSIEVQQSRHRRRMRVQAGLQGALPVLGRDEEKVMMSLGEVSHCLLEI